MNVPHERRMELLSARIHGRLPTGLPDVFPKPKCRPGERHHWVRPCTLPSGATVPQWLMKLGVLDYKSCSHCGRVLTEHTAAALGKQGAGRYGWWTRPEWLLWLWGHVDGRDAACLARKK